MTPIRAFAPAKVNLALHVTGRRADGYHDLDSLVMFADLGDVLTVSAAPETTLALRGPMAAALPPAAGDNLVLRAAELAGIPAAITLEKQLPVAAGLGGGSSDVAALWRALEELGGRALGDQVDRLGADVPVCRLGRAARMQGIGDRLSPLPGLPALPAVLVNPNLPVATAEVFRHLGNPSNPPLPAPLPRGLDAAAFIAWLAGLRNDLQEPAQGIAPVIAQVLDMLALTPGCLLTRMSGSGATCFGLYQDSETAIAAAGRLTETCPGWWVAATVLNPDAA